MANFQIKRIQDLVESTQLNPDDYIMMYDSQTSTYKKIKKEVVVDEIATSPNIVKNHSLDYHNDCGGWSNITPYMDGSASIGVSERIARADHRHPTDTSRAPENHLHDDIYIRQDAVIDFGEL